jgi:hypothetical protein
MDDSSESSSDKILLLGIVYSAPVKKAPSWSHQVPRDRIRCVSLEENLSMNVFSMDDKHIPDSAVSGKHCQSNFSDPCRLFKNLKSTWGQKVKFNHICLDYFFSPQGWAGDRWTKHFFSGSIPQLQTKGWLQEGASIWLPNIPHVSEKLDDYRQIISQYYTIEAIPDPRENPLFLATDRCKVELEQCTDVVTNDNELPKLNQKNPFFRLRAKGRGACSDDTDSSRSTKKRKAAAGSLEITSKSSRSSYRGDCRGQ